jgi:hypothetical protein
MFSGSGGGILTTGRSLNLNGVDYKGLLGTVAQAFGGTGAADVPNFGGSPVSGIFT